MKLLLKQGMIVSSQGKRVADLLIEGGLIKKISQEIVEETDMMMIDCEGKIVMPGVIDTHVHLREPGGEHKEDFTSGSKAAVRGGVTTVLDMPNNDPMTSTVDFLEEKYQAAEGRMLCNYGFYIAAMGDNLHEIKKADRAVGVKLYLGSSTGSDAVQQDLDAIFELMKKDVPLVVHAEDEDRIQKRREKFVGDDDPATHSLIRDDEAAYMAVKKILHLQKKHGTRLHIAHMSTAKEVEELREFKNEKVTAEVATHHLFLTTDAYSEHGTLVQMNPPLRDGGDKQAMWDALREGIIDNVITDHAPHTVEEKRLPYGQAPSGVPGLETLLPLMLDAVNHGELELEKMVEVLCEKPAEMFGLKRKGRIEIGCDADIVIADMGSAEEVGARGYHSKCGWSPYDGWRLVGWPMVTVVGGRIVMREGNIVEEFAGEAVM